MVPLVFAAEAGTLELSDRTGADVRAGTGGPTSYDALTAANARVAVIDRRWSLTAGYSPTVSVSAVEGTPTTPYVVQSENVGVAWRARSLTLSLAETGSYGWQYTANLVPQPVAPTAVLPITRLPSTLAVLQMVSLSTTVSAQYVPARRWTLGLTAGYAEGGGARDVDRAIAPLTYGLSAMGSATFAVTRRDSGFLRVFGLRSWTMSGPCLATGATELPAAGTLATCAPDSDVGTVTVGDQHTFSRASTAMAGIGVGVARARLGPDQPYTTGYYPTALVSYVTAFGPRNGRMSLRFDGQIAPLVDTWTGALDYSTAATATIRSTFVSRAAVALALGALQSLGDEEERPTTTVFASGLAEYPIGKYVFLNAMATYSWQDQLGSGATSLVGFFVGATMHTLPLRFQL